MERKNQGDRLELEIRVSKGCEWIIEFQDLQTDDARRIEGIGRRERISYVRSDPRESNSIFELVIGFGFFESTQWDGKRI